MTTSQVLHGTTTAYGSTAVAPTPSYRVTYVVTLTGLTPGTLYHFQVTNTDAAGNTVSSPDKTFTTANQ